MKVGLIADVHGNAIALKAVLDQLKELDVSSVMCMGDIVGYYPFVNESIELLQEARVACIQGNHEVYLLGLKPISHRRWQDFSLAYVSSVVNPVNRSWLEQLPPTRQTILNGLHVHAFHGSPWDIEEYVYPDYKAFYRFGTIEADVVVLGHTHIPMVRRVGDVLLVNPGSCGQPRDYNPLAAYAVLDTETRTAEIHRVNYDVDTVCKRTMAEGLDRKLIDILKRTRGEV